MPTQHPPTTNRRLCGEPQADAFWLCDAYQPGLKAGRYRFVASQNIEVGAKEQHHYYSDQTFIVNGPRFHIDPSDIHAYFPPQNSSADYTNILPHLVFRKRGLPWERDLGASQSQPEPWLALILVSEAEWRAAGMNPRKRVPRSQLNPAATQPQSHILGPDLGDEGEDPNLPIDVVDLPVTLFRKIAPSRSDLPMLAHLRCVSIADKTPLEMHASGDFSVLVANRFPGSGQHIAMVLSLEGWGDLLANHQTVPEHITHLRWVNPITWHFHNDDSGHDNLAGLMAQLDIDGLGQTVASPNQAVVEKLRQGLVPVAYQSKDRPVDFAWYRGPFSPTPVKPPAQGWVAIQRYEDAMLWDESTGTVDMTYAAAWQLGRMLALASDHFSSGLRTFLVDCRNTAEAAQRFSDFIVNHRGAMDREARDQAANAARQISLANHLLEWLANLLLLYPVPFHYLIPDRSLLPTEALRFFHIDNHWLAALAGGALSTGIHSRIDFQAAQADLLLKPLSQIIAQYRQRQLGLPLEGQPKGDFMTLKKTGFLLRSRMVRDWPGLEVKLGGNARILRFDRLGDDVMLAVVQGHLQSLHFQEPREGLSFGTDSAGNLTPRRVDQAGQHLDNQRVDDVRHHFTRPHAAEGVLDVSALSKRLATIVGRQDFGSALLAMQLLRAPEIHEIIWSST